MVDTQAVVQGCPDCGAQWCNARNRCSAQCAPVPADTNTVDAWQGWVSSSNQWATPDFTTAPTPRRRGIRFEVSEPLHTHVTNAPVEAPRRVTPFAELLRQMNDDVREDPF